MCPQLFGRSQLFKIGIKVPSIDPGGILHTLAANKKSNRQTLHCDTGSKGTSRGQNY